jgi:hypothetical protein
VRRRRHHPQDSGRRPRNGLTPCLSGVSQNHRKRRHHYWCLRFCRIPLVKELRLRHTPLGVPHLAPRLMAQSGVLGTVRSVPNTTSEQRSTRRWSRLLRSRRSGVPATPPIGVRRSLEDTLLSEPYATEPFISSWSEKLEGLRTAWGPQGVVLAVLSASRTDATADQLAELALLLPSLVDRTALCDCVNLLLGAPNADARVVRPLSLEEFSGVLRTSRPGETTSPAQSMDRTFGLGFSDLFSRVVLSHNKSYTLNELLEELQGTTHAIPLVLRGWNNDALALPGVLDRVRALPRTGAEVASHLVLSGSDETFEDLCLLAESVLLTTDSE